MCKVVLPYNEEMPPGIQIPENVTMAAHPMTPPSADKVEKAHFVTGFPWTTP